MKTSALLSLSLVLGLSGCITPFGPRPPHDARTALAWPGTYRGILPCADCEGIETVITLSADGTYRERTRYLGKDGKLFRERGRLSWNESGDIIRLEGAEPARYRVGDNRLVRLALDGSPITGALADNYVLTKQSGNGLTETYWKLVELRGKRVPKLAKEPYLMLKTQGARVTGFDGCNSLAGSYTLDEAASRIRFGQMVSTMRACLSGANVDKDFKAVLDEVDNYSLSGDHLSLNRARMAPLARFEAGAN